MSWIGRRVFGSKGSIESTRSTADSEDDGTSTDHTVNPNKSKETEGALPKYSGKNQAMDTLLANYDVLKMATKEELPKQRERTEGKERRKDAPNPIRSDSALDDHKFSSKPEPRRRTTDVSKEANPGEQREVHSGQPQHKGSGYQNFVDQRRVPGSSMTARSTTSTQPQSATSSNFRMMNPGQSGGSQLDERQVFKRFIRQDPGLDEAARGLVYDDYSYGHPAKEKLEILGRLTTRSLLSILRFNQDIGKDVTSVLVERLEASQSDTRPAYTSNPKPSAPTSRRTSRTSFAATPSKSAFSPSPVKAPPQVARNDPRLDPEFLRRKMELDRRLGGALTRWEASREPRRRADTLPIRLLREKARFYPDIVVPEGDSDDEVPNQPFSSEPKETRDEEEDHRPLSPEPETKAKPPTPPPAATPRKPPSTPTRPVSKPSQFILDLQKELGIYPPQARPASALEHATPAAQSDETSSERERSSSDVQRDPKKTKSKGHASPLRFEATSEESAEEGGEADVAEGHAKGAGAPDGREREGDDGPGGEKGVEAEAPAAMAGRMLETEKADMETKAEVGTGKEEAAGAKGGRDAGGDAEVPTGPSLPNAIKAPEVADDPDKMDAADHVPEVVLTEPESEADGDGEGEGEGEEEEKSVAKGSAGKKKRAGRKRKESMGGARAGSGGGNAGMKSEE